MKISIIAAIALALGLSAATTQAITFSYSYSFGSGLVMSGSLDGDQNGNFVENVSNVSVFFNGISIPGSVYTARFTGSSWVSDPIVSFDVNKNNFLFINGDIVGGTQGFDSYFYILNDSVYNNSAAGFSAPLNASGGDFSTQQSRWSLAPARPAAANVPDGGTTVALLGLAMTAVAGIRRKLRL